MRKNLVDETELSVHECTVINISWVEITQCVCVVIACLLTSGAPLWTSTEGGETWCECVSESEQILRTEPV